MEWTSRPSAPLIVEGVEIEYACYGPPPGVAPTIVLLHEGLGCVTLWRDFPNELADRTACGVFVYSRPGYGRSAPKSLPWPIDFMTREAVDVLPKVLDAIAAKHVILFGHSDGASIAAIYAGSVEDFRVRGLVLMAPHFFTEPDGLAEIARARHMFETTDLRARMAKYHNDPDMAFRGWADTWLNPDFADWNVADVIDYFRVPALVIQGKEDQYGTLAQVQEVEDRSYAPVDTLVLENCKHAPHFEQTDRVLDEVAEFTTRLRRIEAAVVETI